MGTLANSRTVIIALFVSVLFCPPLASAFDTFEHFYVGNVAWKQACRSGELNDVCSKVNFRDLSQDTRWPALLNQNSSFRKETASICLQSECPSTNDENALAINATHQIPLAFGDLTALAGDFTKDPIALAAALVRMADPKTHGDITLVDSTRQHLIYACQWLEPAGLQLAKCTDMSSATQKGVRTQASFGEVQTCMESQCEKLLSWDRSDSSDPNNPVKGLVAPVAGYVLSRAEEAEFESISGYVSLARQNEQHFPTYSWKTYREHHDSALVSAADYAVRKDQRDLNNAIVEEGFAQHFLQDSFAAGHISSAWGVSPWWSLGIASDPNRDTLKDAHDTINRLGLPVGILNLTEFDATVTGSSRATRPPPPSPLIGEMRNGWMAYGDDSLLTEKSDLHRRVVVAAAKQSLLEVLNAAKGSRDDDAHFDRKWSFPVPLDQKIYKIAEVDSSGNTERDKCDGLQGSALEVCECDTLQGGAAQLCRLFNEQPDAREKETGVGAVPSEPTGDLVQWSENRRSPDFRVSNPLFEGWKVMAGAGLSTGSISYLNPNSVNGNGAGPKIVTNRRHNVATQTFDLGDVPNDRSIPLAKLLWVECEACR